MGEKKDFVESIILKVEELKNQKKNKEALGILEKNIMKYSNDYRIFEELADIYTSQGEEKKGMAAIDFALELNAESATGNYLKGFLCLITESFDEAVKYLEKSNSLLGNNSEVLRNLGFVHTIMGKTEKGICILKRALYLSPSDILIKEDLAMALINNGEILEGNVLLRQVKKIKGA